MWRGNLGDPRVTTTLLTERVRYNDYDGRVGSGVETTYVSDDGYGCSTTNKYERLNLSIFIGIPTCIIKFPSLYRSRMWIVPMIRTFLQTDSIVDFLVRLNPTLKKLTVFQLTDILNNTLLHLKELSLCTIMSVCS